ncbi:5-formyltetrahydrofolate cyclo-ligase [Leucobacter massiliensis]|uniref:5-formyltetrahydrofolate cyclo-ligase n=1 Tax=Leucobacter massiliensis TaxID=1686285 RepID=A0A2S9QPT7_9MICO|nr:5-formyltetrahydrofolate cyclo-ligase [Leucobacter massiliensis]PRI11609.1 5-formyltetrahydrofolate cyclo-ligase [Leucobacter massiliensis]
MSEALCASGGSGGSREPRGGSEDEKRRVRALVRARRRAMSEDARSAAGALLAQRLGELVAETGARSVTCYASLPDEPATWGFLQWAEREALEVLLPVIREERGMDWIRASGELRPGPLGILEPVGVPATSEELARVELMLVPACAVDERGTRLGWGGGYFDRFLASREQRPPVFALVFDADVVPGRPGLPRDPHDAPVDGAVTPERILRFGSG